MIRTPGAIARTVLTIGAAVAMAACGSPRSAAPATGGTHHTADTPTAAPSSEPPANGLRNDSDGKPTRHTGTGTTRCAPTSLTGAITPLDPAAGQRYATLVVTNTGGDACTLFGYGGLALIGANGQPLPTTLHREPNPGPAMVTLAPGARAKKELHWTVVPADDEAGAECEPAPGSLAVLPPDETAPFTVSWNLGPVCQHGEIFGSAYHA